MVKEIKVGKCINISSDGQGIVYLDSKKTFVPSLLIDEEAEIEILYRKKDFNVGKLTKLITNIIMLFNIKQRPNKSKFHKKTSCDNRHCH